MAKAKSCEATEEFWKHVEPLIPIRQQLADQSYVCKAGGGRKPNEPRLVFDAIVFKADSRSTSCQVPSAASTRSFSMRLIRASFSPPRPSNSTIPRPPAASAGHARHGAPPARAGRYRHPA